MSTAYDNYIFSLEEPDLIVCGNSKRYQPIIPAWMAKNEVMDKMREKIGQAAFDENMKFDSLTDAEKQVLNDKYLQQHGL